MNRMKIVAHRSCKLIMDIFADGYQLVTVWGWCCFEGFFNLSNETNSTREGILHFHIKNKNSRREKICLYVQR